MDSSLSFHTIRTWFAPLNILSGHRNDIVFLYLKFFCCFFVLANSVDPDEMLLHALGLQCLPKYSNRSFHWTSIQRIHLEPLRQFRRISLILNLAEIFPMTKRIDSIITLF